MTFTEEQWELIERFRGVVGSDDAEIVRNIVLAWLAEKSVVAESVKRGLGAEPRAGKLSASPGRGERS